ncbi:MAG: hypothetical protein P8X91_01075 [Candidatus Bathyarchaeota archaeon]
MKIALVLNTRQTETEFEVEYDGRSAPDPVRVFSLGSRERFREGFVDI